jgi:hypothetical protein
VFPDELVNKRHVNLRKSCTPMHHLQLLHLEILNVYAKISSLDRSKLVMNDSSGALVATAHSQACDVAPTDAWVLALRTPGPGRRGPEAATWASRSPFGRAFAPGLPSLDVLDDMPRPQGGAHWTPRLRYATPDPPRRGRPFYYCPSQSYRHRKGELLPHLSAQPPKVLDMEPLIMVTLLTVSSFFSSCGCFLRVERSFSRRFPSSLSL